MKTLVIGASTNPGRISYSLIKRLRELNIEVLALGRSGGTIKDVIITEEWPQEEKIHTATIYINPKWQTDDWQSRLLKLQPQRVIFNPGAENPAFEERLRSDGIEVINACTLVMLNTGQF